MAALIAAGSANAQTTPPDFIQTDTYGINGTSPGGFDLSKVGVQGIQPAGVPGVVAGIPGLTLPTPTTQVLENAGTGAAGATGSLVSATATGVLHADGTSVQQSYTQWEATAVAGTYVNGTLTNTANVLVNSHGNAVTATAAAAAGIDLSGVTALPTGFSWVPLSTEDTKQGAALYNFVAANYHNDITVAGVAAAGGAGTVLVSTSTSTSYLLNNTTNTAATAFAYNTWYGTLSVAQKTALDQAANASSTSGNPAAYNAEILALGGTFHAVSGGAVDATLAAATNLTYQGQAGVVVNANAAGTADDLARWWCCLCQQHRPIHSNWS